MSSPRSHSRCCGQNLSKYSAPKDYTLNHDEMLAPQEWDSKLGIMVKINELSTSHSIPPPHANSMTS